MKATVNDPGTRLVLEHQLRTGKVEFLELSPVADITVQDHTFAVFSTLMCPPNSEPIGAYVVTVMGHSGYYNQDCYPTPQDAVAQHIGRLAADNHLIILDTPDGSFPDVEEEPNADEYQV